MQGRVRLVRDTNHQFTAMVDSEKFHIKPYNVRGLPDGVTNEELGLADMYFSLTEDGLLKATPRLRGGDPIITWSIIGGFWLFAIVNYYFFTTDEEKERLRPRPVSATHQAYLDQQCAADMKRRRDKDIAEAKETYDRGLTNDPERYYKAKSTLAHHDRYDLLK